MKFQERIRWKTGLSFAFIVFTTCNRGVGSNQNMNGHTESRKSSTEDY
jgi:hypothetical protein